MRDYISIVGGKLATPVIRIGTYLTPLKEDSIFSCRGNSKSLQLNMLSFFLFECMNRYIMCTSNNVIQTLQRR